MVSLLFIMDGSIKTMNSTWNGPPGQLVRALGKCFHPYTNIKLENGIIKHMKDVNLGDILVSKKLNDTVFLSLLVDEQGKLSLLNIENKKASELSIINQKKIKP